MASATKGEPVTLSPRMTRTEPLVTDVACSSTTLSPSAQTANPLSPVEASTAFSTRATPSSITTSGKAACTDSL